LLRTLLALGQGDVAHVVSFVDFVLAGHAADFLHGNG
jgi:hypothetical protein